MNSWQVALELNEDRECVRGSAEALCDPYTLRFAKTRAHYAVRWFVDDSPASFQQSGGPAGQE